MKFDFIYMGQTVLKYQVPLDVFVGLNELYEQKKKELEKQYADNEYQRKRLEEYPSIQELVVALYDADDKAEIDKKRAEIKKKYPKPE